MTPERGELEQMWFRSTWDPDAQKYRYFAGEKEVDHKTWHHLQYHFYTKGSLADA